MNRRDNTMEHHTDEKRHEQKRLERKGNTMDTYTIGRTYTRGFFVEFNPRNTKSSKEFHRFMDNVGPLRHRRRSELGYLGTSRVVLNHFDVSTQADIQHVALSYESEDEIMGRLHKGKRGTPHYSKQDIREQYCISNRGLGALENDKQSLFGCLSSHHSSPCSNRPSFLTACVRQKVPSDENLYELYKRHPSDYAPYPRRNRNPWGPLMPEMYHYDEDLKTSYFRRKVIIDPSRYTWMPSDDESIGLEKPRSIIEHSFHPQQITPPATIVPVKKHVSFARSHTMASFDDAISSLSSSTSQLNRIARSQERLLDVRKTEIQPITKQPESENIVIMDKIKRTPMKTQATQTEIGLGRKPLPPSHINLSPRTIHRVKMVSQGAQTNGIILNGRKLVKSFSEAGNKFGLPSRIGDFSQFETILDHEPLQRTQSDEPPRSPFMLTTPPAFCLPDPPQPQLPQSDSSSLSKSDHESEDSAESKKEIFIDFKPQVPQTSKKTGRRCLTKTMSDGEILMEQRKTQKTDDSVVPEKAIVSVSHENITAEETDQRSFTPYFQKMPIRNEGIFKPLDENVYSSFDGGVFGQDSLDEEFHENIIYNRIYLNRAESQENGPLGIESISPNEGHVVPSVCLTHERLSPFASNDSLANDTRDQSDGIWNESQVTVLQVDSGTDNGTALSSSEMTSVTSPGSANLLTPSSRRKHLLMLQHQQRSSMDTEALDEEIVDESDTCPRIIVDKPIKKQLEPPLPSSRHYLSAQNAVPSLWRKTVQESPIESPLPAVVPDLLLARTDSCKTNTDVSESTTTDDYITANSGTDSSRKSGSIKGINIYNLQAHLNEGSSFESTKGVDLLGDDMVVPSFSPPGSVSGEARASPASRSQCNTPVPVIRTGRSTPSDDTSSSCGSYSVGSTPDLLERSSVPLESAEKRAAPTGEVYNPLSAYHDSSTKQETKLQKRRKEFSLDLSTNQPVHFETYSLTSNGKYKSYKRESKASPQNEMNKLMIDKPKRSKARMRSPMQGQKKIVQSKKLLYREGSPFKEERENKGTSDESSCDMAVKQLSNQTSPRKSKKNKENIRRKSLPRSPVNQRPVKRSEIEEKPSSLPGSLSRRKSKQNTKTALLENVETTTHYSPIESPPESKVQTLKKCPDTTKLKALSAESLRSVSPGSDSVFYSDPSSHTADHQVHCLHCGKEVDIVTTDDPDKSISSNENHHDIVQPPAGFEDSPRTKSAGRLYKKLDRRIRSEERAQLELRKHRYKPDIRAKSEERGAKSYKSKLRPMAKSTNSSQEQLKATDSSPSVLPGAPDDDDDNGIYDMPYNDGFWIYIDEREEVIPCKLSTETESTRRESVSSTDSEQEFRKRYQAITHRMVHRKSCLEMYKRQNSKSFDGRSADTSNDYVDIRQKLEEILKLMLVIWCQENKALNLTSSTDIECDKTVIVHRESGEFGFRIHGSKPVVVSAIEPGTPAETSGLEVGDIVLSVNGVSVLDKSHSEVVKIAHAGSDTLKLEVARTCYALNLQKENHNSLALYSGYLWKLSGYASGTTTNKWIRRWFSLKQNNCLYYYKTDSDKQPVGVVMLFDQQIHKLDDNEGGLSKPNRFVIQRSDAVPLHLAADNNNAQDRWLEVLGRAIANSQKVDDYLNETRKNLTLPPSAICQPDCFGYLVKLGTQWKSWNRRYCVLKDACLYFYQDANAKYAFGVACLHGYRVQQSVAGSKKHAFEVIPPDPNKKYYYFHTESEADRKRWLAALEYSIDRWLKIQ